MRPLTTTMLLGLLLAGAACAAPQPTFVAEFDEGFDGAGRAGKVAATLEGKPELVEGKFGKALKSGPGTGYLRFDTKGVVSPEAGTVEMWVCPLDWDGRQEKFHAFFDARGEGALYLYKYWQGGLLMLSTPGASGPLCSAAAEIASWKPGEWHHVAGTWSASRQCVYVDGKRIGACAPALPKSLESFLIGDHPWHFERTSSSLIDRVRIYDRLLSDEHIAAHFAGDYAKSVPLSEKSAQLTLTVDSAAKRLTALAQILGADAGAEEARVAFSIEQAGATVESQPPAAFDRGSASSEFALAGLKTGVYALVATVTAAGKEVARLSRSFGVPSTGWRGNTIGMEERVLPPWTPVKTAAGPTVACWGRTYSFGAGPLPAQIASKGEKLLARPVTLSATAGGKPITWLSQPARRRSATRVAAVIEGGAVSEGGQITVKTSTRIEYDGLALIDLAIDAPADWRPDRVTLDIPLRKEVALYRHRWAPAWEGLTGNLPAGEGVVDKASFIPYAWLGDNDRGLFWFCESAQQWPNWDAENALETVREGDAVILRLNLAAAGQEIPRPWRFQFGLQATPVKPLPKDWRKWRLLPAPKANVAIFWPTPDRNSSPYFGYPDAADPGLFAKRVSEHQARGLGVVPYSCLSFLSGASPEYQWFGKGWSQGGGDAGSSDVAAYGAVFEMVCPRPRDYQDFIIWKNKELMERFKLDGYYHDNTHPYPCQAEATGCGWVDKAGKRHPHYPILAYRDLYRRLYAMAKGENRNAFLMAHMSGKVTIPILAYEDSYLDGEHFRGRVKDSYLDLMSLDTFRAEYMGRQWGIMPFFLPELSGPSVERPEPTRGLMALLMLHDVQPWAIWCHKGAADEALNALDSFGVVKADFIPYFDPNPPATTDMKDVYVSVYKRGRKALAIVANLSREDRSGTVTLDPKRIGVPAGQVLSWTDRTPASQAGTGIKLDVPGLGYRMLLIGKPPSNRAK